MADNPIQLNFDFTDDGATLRVGETSWKLSASEIDGLVAALRRARVVTAPPVPTEPSQAAAGLPVVDPYWTLGRDVMTGNAVLSLREPSLAWLHFSIPAEEARDMAQTLLSIADAVDASRKTH